VARCLALADAFADRGYDILFAVGKDTTATIPALARYRFECIESGTEDELQKIKELATESDTWLVLDHRARGTAYETGARQWARRVITLSDFPDRPHDCDALIDQTIGRRVEEYAGRVPQSCKLMTGAEYALVGKQFTARRDEGIRRRKQTTPAKHLLLSFGATDPFEYVSRLLPALLSETHFEIVIAAGGQPLDVLEDLAQAERARVSILRAANDMPGAIIAADLAVGLAGASAWERCTLGLPSAMFIPSDYYRLVTTRMVEAGAATLVGENNFNPRETAKIIAGIAADRASLVNMSQAAFALCDGQGAGRAIAALR
jgi:UDP-2,4-diacetamido-2,4,6-trideoxy-beta-L-altropyranose hydrolase